MRILRGEIGRIKMKKKYRDKVLVQFNIIGECEITERLEILNGYMFRQQTEKIGTRSESLTIQDSGNWI